MPDMEVAALAFDLVREESGVSPEETGTAPEAEAEAEAEPPVDVRTGEKAEGDENVDPIEMGVSPGGMLMIPSDVVPFAC